MKTKSWLLALSTVLFLACNDHVHSGEADAHAHEHHAGEASGLSLNNGEKWQADSITHVHVNSMEAKVKNFNPAEENNIEAYHSLAKELQTDLNGLIKDCKMKGKDHDALHLWLEPVLQQVASTSSAASVAEAKEPATQVIHSIQQFDQYFK